MKKHRKSRVKDRNSLSLAFSLFAKSVSAITGNALSFLIAVLLVAVWLIAGPFFHYSNTWQLIINTATTIITFLIVFLIQNTQNRDTEIINIKLDELIRGLETADNSRLDLASLSDDELKALEEHYKKICQKRNNHGD